MGCLARAGDMGGMEFPPPGSGRRCFRLVSNHSVHHHLQFGEPWMASVSPLLGRLQGRCMESGSMSVLGSGLGAGEELWLKPFWGSGLVLGDFLDQTWH